MKKTLTEQWKNGELPNGNYYTICSGWNMQTFPCIAYCERNHFDASVIEVLAPVPSYEELQKMKEQIQEANECIKDKYLFTCSACSLVGSCMSCGNKYFGRYIKKWGVE